MADSIVRIVGAEGSPYTRKMRAVLRYRRIPFLYTIKGSKDDVFRSPTKVDLIPVLCFPTDDGYASMIDSTFQIERLERLYRERSLVPRDPAIAFLDKLLEDYGDEWVTKMMFHYRWYYAPDIDRAGEILPRWTDVNTPEERVQSMKTFITKRQVSRLYVVGSNDTTAPVIEASYVRLLKLLDAHLTDHPFIAGQRPSAADFGIFGQLTQLVLFDPTPAALALEIAPRVHAWVLTTEDRSGLEVDDEGWFTRDHAPDTYRALLGEVGRVYAPFLLANAAALESGASSVDCEIDGTPWTQQPFPYQGRCLQWLRDEYQSLADGDRKAVDGLLAGTGCEVLF